MDPETTSVTTYDQTQDPIVAWMKEAERLTFQRDKAQADAAMWEEVANEYRAAIQKAPHANHCDAKPEMWPGACSCWKRAALTGADPSSRNEAT